MDLPTCTLGTGDLDTDVYGYSNVDADKLRDVVKRIALGVKLGKIPLPRHQCLKIACSLANEDMHVFMLVASGSLIIPEDMQTEVEKYEAMDDMVYGHANLTAEHVKGIHQRVLLALKMGHITLPRDKNLKIAFSLANEDIYFIMFYSRQALFVPEYHPEELLAYSATACASEADRREQRLQENKAAKEAGKQPPHDYETTAQEAQTGHKRYKERIKKLKGKYIQLRRGVPLAGPHAKQEK